jgi:O-antigen ligase
MAASPMILRRHYLAALLVGLSLFGFPIVASVSSILETPSTPLSITVRAVVVALALVLILSAARVRASASSRIVIYAALMFWAIYALRIIHYTNTATDAALHGLYFYFMWGIGTCALPMAAVILASSAEMIHRAYSIAFKLAVFALLLTLPNARSIVEIDGALISRGRLQLEALNPISLGQLGGLVSAFCIWHLLSARIGLGNPLWLLVFCAIAMVGALILIGSGSRGPMLATGLLVLLISVAHFRNRRTFLFLGLVALGFSLFLTQTTVLDQTIQHTWNRISSVMNATDPAVNSRFLSYRGALLVFFDNPILGGRMEDPLTVFYPHNIILEALMATGLLGGAFLLIVLGYCSVLSVRLILGRNQYGWIGLVFLFYLLQGQFSGALYQSTGLWTAIGLTLATQIRARY